MKPARKAMLLMATAQTMMELSQGLEVETDLSEIIGALHMVGLDGEGIMRNNTFIHAIQIVCREFAAIELTDEDITDMVTEDAEDDDATK